MRFCDLKGSVDLPIQANWSQVYENNVCADRSVQGLDEWVWGSRLVCVTMCTSVDFR